MLRSSARKLVIAVTLVAGFGSIGIAAGRQAPAKADKIAITTASDEARRLYLKGRDLAEALRATDARRFYEQAVASDPRFALAYVGLANTSGTAKQFFDALTQAVKLADGVSEGERHLILGLEAGAKSDAAGQGRHYTELVRAYPNDERAHTLLGTYYFGRQDYATAVEHYKKATAINSAFAPVYNQLGYSYRFLEKYPDAEQAFRKYIELIPGDPNPYDSYAELLMKMGRFDESIKNYEKALSLDKNFVASYVGIGNNQLFMDRPDEARATFAKLAAVARTTGERRTAHLWTAAAYVHQGETDKAIAEIKRGSALAEADGDMASMSGDLNQIGDILREAGQFDQALAKYGEALEVMSRASVPDEVKAATRRNTLFELGRVAVMKQDVATAKAKAAEYGTQVAAKAVPFEVRQQHELNGLIALAENRPRDAVAELKKANQQDPRVLHLLAKALQASGEASEARAVALKAADYNALAFNYAFVRKAARKMSAS
jgi:tetratricopeptide (TPR) repeat protein